MSSGTLTRREMIKAAAAAGLASACAPDAFPRVLTALSPPPPSATWPNEPSGWTTALDYDCSAFNDGGWTDSGDGNTSVVDDATAPLSPTKVWQFTQPIGMMGGVGPGFEYSILPPTQAIYVGFWLKIGSPFQDHWDPITMQGSHIQKLFLVEDNLAQFGSYWLRMIGPAPFHTYCEFEYDQPTQNYFENQDTSSIILGQWQQYEYLLNRSGGILQWWVDGKLKGSYSGIYMAGTAFSTEIHLQFIWGGVGLTKTESDYFWVDHIHVSTP